jgi:diaminopimelate decarboxylase
MTDSSFEIFSPFLFDEIEDKNRILYTLQGDKKEEIEKFLKIEVRRFVVDNENDLKNLLDVVKANKEKIDLL